MKVFIASTYIDCIERRDIVKQAVERAGMSPVGMEGFPAGAHPAVDECRRLVGESDLLVCIIANRYGSIPDGEEISITEIEYDAARRAGIPCLVFTASTPASSREGDREQGSDCVREQEMLDRFRRRLQTDQMAVPFTDKDLGMKVLHSLTELRRRRGLAGVHPESEAIPDFDEATLYNPRALPNWTEEGLPFPAPPAPPSPPREHRKFVTKPGAIEMVHVPGGTFRMGSPPSEEGRYGDEGPAHEVTVPSVLISRYVVTNEQYGRFLSARPDVPEPGFWNASLLGAGNRPVVGVHWSEARSFAEWVGGRLPTEAEWEHAARAGTSTRYWWGDAPDPRLGNFGRPRSDFHRMPTTPVDAFAPNPFGLYDVHGNVWEWLEDHWHSDYTDAPTDGRAWLDTTVSTNHPRVIRGGSFLHPSRRVRAANRRCFPPHATRCNDLGFRVAVSASAIPESWSELP